jgi:hypothetical protein
VLLAPLEDGNLEGLLLARSPRFQALMERSRRSIQSGRGLTHKDFWKAVARRQGQLLCFSLRGPQSQKHNGPLGITVPKGPSDSHARIFPAGIAPLRVSRRGIPLNRARRNLSSEGEGKVE